MLRIAGSAVPFPGVPMAITFTFSERALILRAPDGTTAAVGWRAHGRDRTPGVAGADL